MDNREKVIDFWKLFNEAKFRETEVIFDSDAVIYWKNTNEKFKVNNFLLVNEKYPGKWNISMESIYSFEDIVVSVVRIELEDKTVSLYDTSFFKFKCGKIYELTEYFSDNIEPPEWRKTYNISFK